MKNNTTVKDKVFFTKERKQLIFYISLIILPCIQICVFYIGVNFNSILLSLKNYDYLTGEYSWVGFRNFTQIFKDFKEVPYLIASVKNSLIVYVFSLISMALSLLFSYYIYKKRFMHEVYRIFLYMPQIISSLVLVLMFKYFTEKAVPAIYEAVKHETLPGLLSSPKTIMPTLLFYYVWASFGGQILIFVSTMNGISESITEAAQIDGVTPIKEFFLITMPLIYPTIVTFLVVGVAGALTNQFSLFAFFSFDAEYEYYTFGYYLYIATKNAKISDYPYIASMGLLLTSVAVPVTFFARWLLNKFDPTV